MHLIQIANHTYTAPLNPTESSRLVLRELSIDEAPKKAAIQGKALNEFYPFIVNIDMKQIYIPRYLREP